MNKLPSRRSQHISSRKLLNALKREFSKHYPPPRALKNAPCSAQDKTTYFWRVSACQRSSTGKIYLYSMTSEVQPGPCMTVCQKKKFSAGCKSPRMPTWTQCRVGAARVALRHAQRSIPVNALVMKTRSYIWICQRTNQFYLFVLWFSVIGILENIIYISSCNYIWN